MTQSAIFHTQATDAQAAGTALGSEIAKAFSGERPDAVMVFASPHYEHSVLLTALQAACQPHNLVGCSSAGEFSSEALSEGAACAVALCAPEMRFASALASGLRADPMAAARTLAGKLQGAQRHDYRFRTALILTDALAGHVEAFVDQLTVETAGNYQFVGGGAGDDARFGHTHVFHGEQASEDAAVVLEILSNKPIGIGVAHAWREVSPPLRVTEAEGMQVVSLNSLSAVEAFAEHAESTQQTFDPAEALPFFLHNVLGIDTGDGFKLRVPLQVESNQAITFAAEVPLGCTARIMGTHTDSAAKAAREACQAALQQLNGQKPSAALFFDCAATRLRLGREFGVELESLAATLGTPYAGCNTYGQIARAEGQFNGFHNCTAVVCIFPE